jgi:ankyrin repeat protein
VFSNMKLVLAAAIAISAAALPAHAQQYSDSYSFLEAVKKRDGAKAQDLLDARASTIINTKDTSSGEGAVHILARERDRSWLAFMLSRGAKPDLQNKQGDTALGIAAQLGWVEGAELLLKAGAGVDLPNRRGETPLILAVHARDPSMVRLLVSKGANPKRTDNVAGYSALDYAKQDKRSAAVVKLLEAPPAKPGKEIAGPKL